MRVGAMELSDNAKKLLKYFQDRNLREMDYEYPSAMEKLFEYDLEACEIAQEELAKAGLLELGSPQTFLRNFGCPICGSNTRRRAISTRENREIGGRGAAPALRRETEEATGLIPLIVGFMLVSRV